MKKIKIGAGNNSMAILHTELCVKQFAEKGVVAELVIFNSQVNYPIFQTMEDALRMGEVDVIVQPLNDLPTTQPEGIVIGGVSHRYDPAEWLLVPTSHTVDNQLFKLKKEAVVGVSSARQKAQMSDFRPDVFFKKMEADILSELENPRGGEYGALLVNASFLDHSALNLSEFYVVKFNPIEFVPAPGQGVFAYRCCADDVETSLLVRLIHHPAVSAVTNIERKVLKLLGDVQDLPLGVFCEQDSIGNYHVHAAFADAWEKPLRRARVSQSTNLLLAENVVAALEG